MAEPEVIADYACQTAERPTWHANERRLYWTDIPAGRMFCYDPATGQHEQIYQGRQVGGMTVQADGSLLLFMDRGTVAVWRDGQLVRTIIDEIPAELTTRFNDVSADPAGRVFCGTMPEKDAKGVVTRPGRLYRLDPDRSLHLLLDGLYTPNGIGFSPDQKTMYFAETGKHTIWQFDYEATSGAIHNQRVFVKTPDDPSEGRPDGLAMDSRGHICSARWDGGCVVRYSPDGQEQQRIRFPVRQVSCPTFGDNGLAQMYVTTAGGNDKATHGPLAGAVFRVDAGISGGPQFVSRVGC